MNLRQRGYFIESNETIRLKTGEEVPVARDVTKEQLEDAMYKSTRFSSQGYGFFVKAMREKSGDSIGKLEQKVLSMIRSEEPIDLGHVSSALLFSKFFDHMKKSEHAAVFKLMKRGKLKVLEVLDPQARYGKEPIGGTGSRLFLVAS